MKRPDGFFHKSPSLLIYDPMLANVTDAVEAEAKKTNSELAVVPDGFTKELQPLDIGVNRPFNAKLRVAWEHWMTDGEHTLTRTGGQRRANYATICQWIVDGWAKITVSTIMRLFREAGSQNNQVLIIAMKHTLIVTRQIRGMLDVKIA